MKWINFTTSKINSTIVIDMRKKDDYLWKGIVDENVDNFLRHLHSDADEIFDFSRGITFLDKELEQLYPATNNDEYAAKIADKLAKIYTRAGEETWILIHCEIQDEYRANFPERMYTYFSRIWDKYHRPVSAYAILIENNTITRTNKFEMQCLNTHLVYQYRVYKVTLQDEEELRKSDNPFALFTLIAKSVMQGSKEGDVNLLEIKRKLAKEIIRKQVPDDKKELLFRFLRMYVHFENTENKRIFEQDLVQLTGGKYTMGLDDLIIDRAKREGRQEGIQKGRQEGIQEGRQEGIQEGLEKGLEKGLELGKREIITNMLINGINEELITQVTGKATDYIRMIRSSISLN
jgi:hypothetical protein